MSEPVDWRELAKGLAEMARDLLAQDSVQGTLDRIVVAAVDLVDGCDAAGILAVRDGRVHTLASTDDVVRASDELRASFRLYTHENKNLGALDLYSSRPGAFAEGFEHVGWLLASHAAVALASARLQANLHEALKSRQVIGAATGIVMARYGLSEREAFNRIVTVSQNSNIKVRDLAREINNTGGIPDLS
ncbi:GAF and ANTAR domain-containing protein [Pseudonocardia eucalypti]|uniref:GAF and ANTAR domain-containing protein n=1 Tax=Pseudonocardia eucalypti TaxID=648755 RepID=A0ABP9QNH5_9PSEU|nr:GAF domain-containing protein [Pseudonocardia eucalypti]